MAKRPRGGYSRTLTIIIRVLIIVIFCVALVITVNRLIEYAQAGGKLQLPTLILKKSGSPTV